MRNAARNGRPQEPCGGTATACERERHGCAQVADRSNVRHDDQDCASNDFAASIRLRIVVMQSHPGEQGDPGHTRNLRRQGIQELESKEEERNGAGQDESEECAGVGGEDDRRRNPQQVQRSRMYVEEGSNHHGARGEAWPDAQGPGGIVGGGEQRHLVDTKCEIEWRS